MQVAWEHEQFSRIRVTAATVSGLSVALNLLENAGGLYDNREFVSEAAVVWSVKLVAESLALAAKEEQLLLLLMFRLCLELALFHFLDKLKQTLSTMKAGMWFMQMKFHEGRHILDLARAASGYHKGFLGKPKAL